MQNIYTIICYIFHNKHLFIFIGTKKVSYQTYYFCNDMNNIKIFDSNLLKIDKKPYKNIGIYYIGYITMKNIGIYDSINSVNPLYLIIAELDGHIEEKWK